MENENAEKNTTQQIADRALEMLDNFAKKLGTTSDKMFGVLVKQAKIDAISSILENACLIAVSIFGIMANMHFMTNANYQQNYGYYFLTAAIIVCLITVFVVINSIGNIITGFINPQYSAMNEIAAYFKSQK